MADASRDSNRVTTLLGVNDVTGLPQPINVNSSGEILVSMTGGGSGDVVGPASSTDNAVARFDGTTGQLIQNSTVLIGDTGAISGVLSVTGVAGGSSVTGGTGASDALTLRSTSNATKGLVAINDQGGNVTIGGGATASELRFLEPSGSGTNYSAFVATAQAANITYTLPAAVGAAGTFLKDAAGNGVLSWAAPAGGGDVVGPAGATDNAIVRFDGATGTLIQNSAVTIADTTGVTTGMVFPNTGLNVQDTNASHNLNIKPGSDLTADRIFTITTGDAARTLSMAGNVTTAADFITSGANSLTLTTTGATDVTLPTSGTLYGTATGSITSAALLGSMSDETGTGVLVFATSPTLVTPILGVASATSINKVAITAPAASATLTIADGKTLTVSDTMTLAGPTGSGNVVFATSPTLVTPVLGVATATSINKVAITAPATSATLTLADGSSLVTSGANSITLTSTGATNVTLPTTGTLATLAGTEELDNKTLDSSVGKGTWTASGTWTLPAWTMGGTVTFGENTELLLDAALSADGKYCGITEGGTAGATLAFGDLCYLAAADSRWELADASAASTSGDVKIGICVLAAAADGNATTMLLYGKIRADAAFPSFTISAPVHISETAGDVVVAAPTTTDSVTRRVGFANTADELFFCPSPDYYTHT